MVGQVAVLVDIITMLELELEALVQLDKVIMVAQWAPLIIVVAVVAQVPQVQMATTLPMVAQEYSIIYLE